MEINVDFLVSGCNTHCRHCYVNGGPGPLMPTEDVLLCIEKLDDIASYLTGEVTFTLDHEPMNHPDVEQIIRAAAGTKHVKNYHHGMTTGIGLMRREDKEAVLETYLESGCSTFGITIHGGAEHHDEIVRRRGAFDAAVTAAEFFKAHGAGLEISLMINRFFPEDAESISELLDRLRPDYIGCVIPIYTPHRNMHGFEPYRAHLPDIGELRGYMKSWGTDEEDFLQKARNLTISSAISRLRQGSGLRDLFRVPQKELYLTLHQNSMLYVGNTGAETERIGDIRTMNPEEAAEIIMDLPGDRDYGAFYDISVLPSDSLLIHALEELPQDLVYGDFESALYRGMAALGIPAKILSFPG